MDIITIILIGLSLSMDAFSLSLIYGSNNINNRKIYKLSLCVGIFHFIMPLLGNFLGSSLLSFIDISSSILMFIILLIIGIQMIIDSLKNDKNTNVEGILLFSLAVSMDSFSIGFSLNSIVKSLFVAPTLFMIISAFFTFVGLKLGGFINSRLGKYATMIGGVFLILIAIVHIL